MNEYWRKTLFFLKTHGLGLIIFLAIILRTIKLRYALYGHINELTRDLIVTRDFLTGKHIPLLGPSSSLGGFNFGAFYYYLLAPFLWISHFYAWGAIAAAGFFSVLQIIMVYLLLKLWFEDRRTALIGALLSAVSIFDIQNSYVYVSNPSLLPFFTLLYLYCLTKLIGGETRILNAAILGFALGIGTQLHATALIILPIIFVLSLIFYRKRVNIKSTLLVIVSSLATYLPFIIFEVQHKFINTFGIFRLGHSYLSLTPNLSAVDPLIIFFGRLFFLRTGYFDLAAFNAKIYYILLVLLVIVGVWIAYRLRVRQFLPALQISKPGNFLLFSWLIVGCLVFIFFTNKIQDYYFLSLWPLPVLFFAWALSTLYINLPKPTLVLFFLFILAQAVQIYYYFSILERRELDYDNYRAIFDFASKDSGPASFKIIDDTGFPYFLVYYSAVYGLDRVASTNNAKTLYLIVAQNDKLSVEPPHYTEVGLSNFDSLSVIRYDRKTE